MRLFIAEKPSLGRAIAENLGGAIKPGGGARPTYLMVGGDAVTWVFGHILEQVPPEAYNPMFKSWRAADLPIVPDQWRLQPRGDAKAQLAVIKDLIGKADEIVHGGDPDREGQLLVDEVLHYLGNRKPVKRILLNAVDNASVKKSLANLKQNKEFENLYQAALGRQRADWLVGMNATRAFTLAGRRNGLDKVLSVGRVQTPTLALIVRRDLEIENFKPSTYFTVSATFDHANGRYSAQFKPAKGAPGLDAEGRLTDAAIADKVVAAVKGGAGTIEHYAVEPKIESPPLPHTLSTLTSAANRRYGYSAKQVLDICQSLYETHKVASYPRTDSPYLPESQLTEATGVLAAIAKFSPDSATAAKGADLKLRSAAWNDKKVSAHHGLVPTANPNYSGLSEAERKVFEMIVQAYVAQFYPPYKYQQTTVLTSAAGHQFASSGRTPTSLGWKVVFGKAADGEEDSKEPVSTLPVMAKGDGVKCVDAKSEKKQTKPPKPYTEGTLLDDMKAVHKFVNDPDLKARLKDCKGIGTEATRASIIETLIKRDLVAKQGKNRVSTPFGRALIAALPEAVTNAGTTGLWESMLEKVEAGELRLEQFLRDQAVWVKKIVDVASTVEMKADVPTRNRSTGSESGGSRSQGSAPAAAGSCPQCGKPLRVMTARKGPNAGNQFVGCTGYPDCKFTSNEVPSAGAARGARASTSPAAGARRRPRKS